ncbi:MAG: hypothetical protein ISF22_08290 [Methanomassiliicoccus sp.]|nr:hypothetical protein [Methanomassiliicoccus sp.]
MRINDIMGLPEIEFNEPAFNVLPDEVFTDMLLGDEASEARLVVDEEDWPLALALRTGRGWKGTNFILRGPTLGAVERFEGLGGEVMMSNQEDWMRATREHYSLALMRSTPPAMEDFSPSRAKMVKALLSEVWGGRQGDVCLDCGCGSGMGSAVLREVGLSPLAYDNDATLLSLGLARGRLLPEETMLIDATLARHYVRSTELGLALMAGTINDHTALIWRSVLHELMDLTRETLITMENEREADLVKMWALGEGRKVRTFENHNDSFYDRWVCLITE